MTGAKPANDDHDHDRQRHADEPAAGKVVDSRDLLREHRELRIRHEGEVYVLRVTRNGRLILNK